MLDSKRTATWLRRRSSLRTRVTVVASVVLAVAITGGIVLLFLLQIDSVKRTVDQQLRTYVAEIAQASPTGTWPSPLPGSGLDSATQAQVIADDGTVLAATRGLAGAPATFALPDGSSTPIRLKGADGAVPNDVRVFAARETINGRQVIIVAGTPTGILSSIDSEFTYRVILGFPIVLTLAAGAVWILVGRALSPVEKIRQAVTDITSADLSHRVPEPATLDEIGQLARTMNQMLGRLEDSARRQRRFVADASHELRSPLAAIQTTLDVGLAYPDRAPWPEIAARASGQSQRLAQLLEKLLVLAKSDEQTSAPRRQDVDVDALLRDVVAGTITGHVDITVNLAGDAVVSADRVHLERVFRNVLENAVRYAATTVEVTTFTTAATVDIRIVDDGPGVAAADRERVFERFVRLDQSRDRATGNSGLGLAIAREIVIAHQGTIWMDDVPRGGAHLVIQLPRR